MTSPNWTYSDNKKGLNLSEQPFRIVANGSESLIVVEYTAISNTKFKPFRRFYCNFVPYCNRLTQLGAFPVRSIHREGSVFRCGAGAKILDDLRCCKLSWESLLCFWLAVGSCPLKTMIAIGRWFDPSQQAPLRNILPSKVQGLNCA